MKIQQGHADATDHEAMRRRLLDGMAAGTIATLIMTGLTLAAPALGGPHLPEVAARALLSLKSNPMLLLLALVTHLAYGSLAGALFAVATEEVTLGRGLLYGLSLWGVAVAIYSPLVGLGFVASHQPGLAALTLPLHLLYGVVLGALVPRGEIVQPIRDAAA